MWKRILPLFFFAASIALAAETPPSEASVRELLEASQARKLVDGMLVQISATMQNITQQAVKQDALDPAAEKTLNDAMTETQNQLRQMLSWDRLELMYIRIYQRSLSQEEVAGMIEFYKSPVGQALINKMPVIMQNTMAEMQAMMLPMMTQFQQKQQELLTRARTEKSAGKAAKKKH